MTTINLIVACDLQGGIGLLNQLPWPALQEDMQWFKKHTINNICIMGSNTWRSLPSAYRPLPDRINVVFSSKPDINYNADVVMNGGRNAAAVSYLTEKYPNKDIYIIGGKTMYEKWLPDVDFIHITKINSTFNCDTFLDIKTLLNSCSLKYNKQAVWHFQKEPTHRVIPYSMETYECNNT